MTATPPACGLNLDQNRNETQREYLALNSWILVFRIPVHSARPTCRFSGEVVAAIRNAGCRGAQSNGSKKTAGDRRDAERVQLTISGCVGPCVCRL